MWQPISDDASTSVLREVTDFGLGKLASVSTKLDGNRWLVFAESIDHVDPQAVDWTRMTRELYASGNVVEAQ